MVSWIQMIFGIQIYHEEIMQVKFEYGCSPIIIAEVTAHGLRKLLENDSFCSFLGDGLMDSNYIWHTDVS
jgi:hypothetical protein